MAAAEDEPGKELAPIFAPDAAEKLEQNWRGVNGSPIKTRRMSGFAAPDYWTPERREEQKQRRKKLFDEGRLGGRQPGAGRPRKTTVAEVVSDKASEKAPQIANMLLNMALNNKSDAMKLGAVDRLKGYEDSHQKNMRDDEKEIAKLSGKSLDQALQDTLAEYGVQYDIELSPGDIEDVN